MQSLRSTARVQLTMKTLVTWNPFGELDEVQNRLGSFFSGRFPRFGNGNGGPKLADWAPQVDITEDDKEYLVKADLPEMKREEIKVNVEEVFPLEQAARAHEALERGGRKGKLVLRL